MSYLKSQRRQRTIVAFVSGVLVLALLPVSGVIAWRAVRDSRAAEAVVSLPTIAVPTTPTAILATTDEQNYLASISILTLAPNGAGGTVLSLPVGMTMNGRPEGDPQRLADVYGSDGIDALKLAVESQTNTQIDLIAVEPERGTGDLIARAGTIDVTYGTDVLDYDDGEMRIVGKAGPNTFTPLQAAAVLAARDPERAENARLPDVRTTWEAIAKAVGAGKIGTMPATVIQDVGAQVPADMASFMSALFAGPVRVWQIGYQLITDTERNPDGLDLYGFDFGEVIMVLASVAPSAMVAVFPTLSLQVDSPYADAEVTRQAVFRLIYMGANVMLVRTTNDPPPAVTTISYSDEMDRGMAEPLTILLDEVTWERATERVAGIDLQVTLGESFVAFLKATAGTSIEDQAASAMSSTTDQATDATVADTVAG